MKRQLPTSTFFFLARGAFFFIARGAFFFFRLAWFLGSHVLIFVSVFRFSRNFSSPNLISFFRSSKALKGVSDEATIAGEGVEGVEHVESAPASGEGDHQRPQLDAVESASVVLPEPPKEEYKIAPKKGYTGDLKEMSKISSSEFLSGIASGTKGPVEDEQQAQQQVKVAVVEVSDDHDKREEAEENPTDLPGTSPKKRLVRTKSDGAKNGQTELANSGSTKLGLSVGKKVKKNTKTLLKKKSPKADRSHRNSVGSTGSTGSSARERRHSLDAKSTSPVEKHPLKLNKVRQRFFFFHHVNYFLLLPCALF